MRLNFVPHLWEYVDVGDLGALTPRPRSRVGPMTAQRGTGTADVAEQLAITRRPTGCSKRKTASGTMFSPAGTGGTGPNSGFAEYLPIMR